MGQEMGPDKGFTRHLGLFKKIRNKQTEHLWNGLQVGKLHQFSFCKTIISRQRYLKRQNVCLKFGPKIYQSQNEQKKWRRNN